MGEQNPLASAARRSRPPPPRLGMARVRPDDRVRSLPRPERPGDRPSPAPRAWTDRLPPGQTTPARFPVPRRTGDHRRRRLTVAEPHDRAGQMARVKGLDRSPPAPRRWASRFVRVYSEATRGNFHAVTSCASSSGVQRPSSATGWTSRRMRFEPGSGRPRPAATWCALDIVAWLVPSGPGQADQLSHMDHATKNSQGLAWHASASRGSPTSPIDRRIAGLDACGRRVSPAQPVLQQQAARANP